MNKDEIEDIKDNLRTLYKVLWNEHREGTYTIERILEYINCLEQKESILNRVTGKLEEIRRELDDDGFGYYAQEITIVLNIIEGGIKND